jgi:hypothetical protein
MVAASEQRKTALAPIASGVVKRPIGCFSARNRLFVSSTPMLLLLRPRLELLLHQA